MFALDPSIKEVAFDGAAWTLTYFDGKIVTVSARGKQKYPAKRTKCNAGYWHRAISEAEQCNLLHLEMRSLENQSYPDIMRVIAIHHERPQKVACKIGWKIDFCLEYADGHFGFVEAKGAETEGFKLKRRMFRDCPIPGLIDRLEDAEKAQDWYGVRAVIADYRAYKNAVPEVVQKQGRKWVNI